MRRSNLVGKIHSIDTYSTLDGYGIRSVIFMQGCNLRCIYCHNPDTWDCNQFTPITSNEIVSKIRNYSMYYGSKGGVTFSGGEPLCQAEFVDECVEKLSKIGIKSCIETSGNVEVDDKVASLIAKLDFVICDLKFPDDESYLKYTGVSIAKTLKFLDFLQQRKVPVWIRTVVVPTINDSVEIMEKYREIVDKYDNVVRWELLPFSKIGFGKYSQLNIVNRLENVQDLDMDQFKLLQERFEKKSS